MKTEKTDYKGIDYGLGRTNRDFKNNIRYGVINQNEVIQAWSEESKPYYGDTAECEHCGAEIDISTSFPDECAHCGIELCWDFMEPISYFIDDGEYLIESDSYGDLFICKSPYYTYAQFCSPCAPGACHLENPIDDNDPNNRCYCLGHDWFDGVQAPYPVYSLKTGKLVIS